MSRTIFVYVSVLGVQYAFGLRLQIFTIIFCRLSDKVDDLLYQIMRCRFASWDNTQAWNF